METSTLIPAQLWAEPDEREQQLNEDYDWALQDPDVRRQYSGFAVAVYGKKVWGSGKTIGDAVAEALKQPGCPARGYLAKVYIEVYSLPSSHEDEPSNPIPPG